MVNKIISNTLIEEEAIEAREEHVASVLNYL